MWLLVLFEWIATLMCWSGDWLLLELFLFADFLVVWIYNCLGLLAVVRCFVWFWLFRWLMFVVAVLNFLLVNRLSLAI